VRDDPSQRSPDQSGTFQYPSIFGCTIIPCAPKRVRGGNVMTITPETQREVLNQLRTAMSDLEAIEEECGGAHDLQLVIELLLEI
jgi:hypothetical protein